MKEDKHIHTLIEAPRHLNKSMSRGMTPDGSVLSDYQ
jgi:hypothetical protein